MPNNRIDLSGLFIAIWIIVFFPLILPAFSLLALLGVIIVSVGFWGIGFSIVRKLQILEMLTPVSQAGICIFMGSTITFILTAISTNSYFLYAIITTSIGISIFHLIKGKAYFTLIPNSHALGYIIAFVTLFYGNNLVEALSLYPIERNAFIDNIFYTSITASLKEGSFYNAFYETGTPLNYHIGGFLGASSYAILANLSSHIATWSVWVPLLRYLCMIMIGELALLIIKDIQPNNNINHNRVFPFAILLYILTAPINPTAILSFDLEKVLWIGTPFTIPDMPALASGFLLSILTIYMAIARVNKSILEKTIFIVLLSFIIACKATFYFVTIFFIGVISVYNLIYLKKSGLFFLLIASLPVTFTIYSIFWTENQTITLAIDPGYLSYYFANLISGQTNSLFIGTLIGLTTIIIVWIGIKNIGLLFLLKEKATFVLFFASLGAIVGSIIIASTFRIYLIDDSNIIIQEISYDLLQFTKASLAIASIIGVTGLYYGYHKIKSKKFKSIFVITIIGWNMIILGSILMNELNRKDYYKNKWLAEVISEIKVLPPGIKAMTSSHNNTGLLITASDIGPFWTTFKGKTGGVATSKDNSRRQKILLDFIENGSLESIKQLKKESVRYIIAIPENIDKLNNKVENKMLIKKGSWVFEIL